MSWNDDSGMGIPNPRPRSAQFFVDKERERKLQRQNRILREALEFYAEMGNWKEFNQYEKAFIGKGDRESVNDADYRIGGKFARKALKECGHD